MTVFFIVLLVAFGIGWIIAQIVTNDKHQEKQDLLALALLEGWRQGNIYHLNHGEVLKSSGRGTPHYGLPVRDPDAWIAWYKDQSAISLAEARENAIRRQSSERPPSRGVIAQ